MSLLRKIVDCNRNGQGCAITSVCSAHETVLIAALALARETNTPILVEATSNQVNQFGGYTGMTPKDFIGFVRGLMKKLDVDDDLVVFGGDHLGPQCWKDKDAETAMALAHDMMRAYVEAGFTKIHLDCSEGCAGEPRQVDDRTSAVRAADLAATCEKYAPDKDKLVYIIGTEVPPPGGARQDDGHSGLRPTHPQDAVKTIEVHKAEFAGRTHTGAWGRVIGVVVQPGVEFGALDIDRFDTASPNALSAALRDYPSVCFEAHSTDFQYPDVYPELGRRNFAILKVGPALTFAYRSAVYALDFLREWLVPAHGHKRVPEVMEELMLAAPDYWRNHYAGEGVTLRNQLHFGYADRIRYLWPQPDARESVETLIQDLSGLAALDPMIAQYFSKSVMEMARADTTHAWPVALIIAAIQEELQPYFRCPLPGKPV